MSEILGINERNLSYLHNANSQKAIRLADNKLATKKILQKTGIYTPRLYGAISNIINFKNFNWDKLPQSFVVKPNMGMGGEGILILRSKFKKAEFLKMPLSRRRWLDSENKEWGFKKLKTHILNILDGNYSISGEPDTAFIERKIILHPIFKNFAIGGIPDIRVIVYNQVPIMAMLRLPTKKSSGKANLHQGAIGVGIDIGSGITTTAMTTYPWRQVIEEHPDTKQRLRGIILPLWDKILEMALEAQIASGLGYGGIDVAIDSKFGPEILELNARPGLDIQIANLEGLASRLRRVRGLKIKNIAHGVRMARELFGQEVEHKIEEISGREIIGPHEPIEILDKEGLKKIKIEAKIDTGAFISTIDRELAKKIGYGEAIACYDKFNIPEILNRRQIEELDKKNIHTEIMKCKEIVNISRVHTALGSTYRPVVRITFFLAGRKIISRASIISRQGLKYPLIIGRRDLFGFLVNPVKYLKSI
jgi:alpha-L-glutamate ligase-like protein